MAVSTLLLSCFLLVPQERPMTLLADRADKDAVGNGRHLAAFAGSGRVWWSTFEMGKVFSPLERRPTRWDPHCITIEELHGTVHETCRVTTLPEDVLVAEIEWENRGDQAASVDWVAAGSIVAAHDFRARPVAGKKAERDADHPRVAVLFEPGIPGGLFLAAGMGDDAGGTVAVDERGDYRLAARIELPPHGRRTTRCALAFHERRADAIAALADALTGPSAVERARSSWDFFFDETVPTFDCPDRRLVELWYFRWWLLRFSTVWPGGALKNACVLEGRSAYQTYCCFSAPFLAMDLRWARQSGWGEEHHMAMGPLMHPDGRYPWYSTVSTAQVPVHHASATGHSFLAATAFGHFLAHGNVHFLAAVWPNLLRNDAWWEKERDPDGDGLYRIDDLLETGMDDAPRTVAAPGTPWQPILGADLASYRYLDLMGIAGIAAALGKDQQARQFHERAARVREAVRKKLWNAEQRWFCDLAADGSGRRCCTKTTAGFYPFFAGIAGPEELGIFDHLLSAKSFRLPFPVPSVAADEPCFDPRSYWCGPAWPATSCHVVAALSDASKAFAPELEPSASALMRDCLAVFTRPRPDFYERYDPRTGEPLSAFRDYMHSWWIDLIVQGIAGLTPVHGGQVVVHPLAGGPEWFELHGVRLHGREIDVVWRNGEYELRAEGNDKLKQKGLPRTTIVIN